MEDKENKVVIEEEETLNQEEKANETDEVKEPKTYTEEEVEEMRKKLQSDSEKWVQKVIGERKRFEKAYKELPKIANDDTRLVELYEEDPELANQILADHFDWQSIQDYKDSIDYKEDYSDPEKMKAKIEREAAKLVSKKEAETRAKEVEKSKDAFIKKLQMEWEELENFESELTELLQLKKYQTWDVTKVMEKAYKLSANDEEIKKLKNQEVIAKSMTSTKWGSTNKGKETEKSKNPFDDFFKTHLNRNK